MKSNVKISDAEWEVMKVLWAKAPIATKEVVEILKPSAQWSSTTIYTLINRLVNKKAVAIKEGSSPHICYPLLSQNEVRSEESRLFIKKVFDGSLNLLFKNLIDENRLSENEIDDLICILDKSREKR